MGLTSGVEERALSLIEEMKKTGARETQIPKTPFTIVKAERGSHLEKDLLPLARFGEYLIIMKGL